MSEIVFITGNEKKLTELQRLLPVGLDITHQALDLDEIQSLDLHEIVRHKLYEAYEQVGKPVLVEDVSAELKSLNGLPGPFIKFFMQRLGNDALYKIAVVDDEVRIVCTMGYFDGTSEHIVDGEMLGRVVAPRGEGAFGFDPVIVPNGYDQTVAELGPEIKDSISHRRKAADAMVQVLSQLS
jgi:non-canonical purine NTP pyrophosphatase (RdgB/HAM1 family)